MLILSAKEQISILNKTLCMNCTQFELELDEGMYGDKDMLQLLKYLRQNKNNCLNFELKIINIINLLVNIYLLEKNI